MKIVVQKFGGTSVADCSVRQLAVGKVAKALKNGCKSIVVVSAMGRKGDNYATDTLLGIAKDSYKDIAKRELDQIMYCGEAISAVVITGTLQAAGIDAVMLSGWQAGIITDANFGSARILKIDTTRLMELLENGKTPVVCGFQGITSSHELTTLGRGGSDTTAAALGVALNAEVIEIYTDVEGIMTADPRIVQNAKILERINYEEVCQLAQQGSKVIHPRAVEIAMQKNIPVVVKSTFSDAPGTIITNELVHSSADRLITDRLVAGVTCLNNIAQIKVEKPNNPGDSSKIFRIMADSGISVDMINIYTEKIIYTVASDLAETAVRKLTEQDFKAEVEYDCAKVSIVGAGMRGIPGVMASFAEALAEKNIGILQTVDSHTSISVLVKKENADSSVIALHTKFGLSCLVC